MFRRLTIVSALLFVPALLGQFHTTLKPKTVAAFEDYRKKAEAGMGNQARYAQLAPGETKVEPAAGGGAIDVPSGMAHDWVAATVIPNTNTAAVVAVLQNYPAYAEVYAPDVVEARTLRQDGNRYRVFLKLVKAKILTAILHSEYDVEYEKRDGGNWRVTSRSTRIVEVERGKELPEGQGFGFLWRLNAYWLLQQRAADVYVECRTLSLTRDIPFGAGFVIRPFVTSLPVESLKTTLSQTVKAVRPGQRQ